MRYDISTFTLRNRITLTIRSMNPASNPPSSEPQTPTSATPSRSYEAAHAVLNTNELICEIFGRLPLEDIVVTTGVCRTWHNALKGNKSIQRALFLVPAGIQEITTTTKCLSMRVEDIPRGQYAIVAEPNPYTARICGRSHTSTRFGWTGMYEREDPPLQEFNHPDGTWQNMFVTQPPVKTLDVEFSFEPYPYHTDSFRFNCDEGITFGNLHRFIESTMPPFYQKSVIITNPTSHGFFLGRSLSVACRYNRWWEVRNGKVHRKIQPPNNMIDFTGDVSDAKVSNRQSYIWPSIRKRMYRYEDTGCYRLFDDEVGDLDIEVSDIDIEELSGRK